MKIALLGAESTGKTTLARQLAARLRRAGHSAAVAPEVLREWCEREGREPRPAEQLAVAQEHERGVDAAAANGAIVIADTTALMIAIWGGILFPDHPLLRFALERQRGYDLTLVMGLDLPWVADGLQRDAAADREHADELVRSLLAGAGVPYRVVYGTGEDRLRSALAALPASLAVLADAGSAERAWAWQCEKCSDPDCEHRLFTALLRGSSPLTPSVTPPAGRRTSPAPPAADRGRPVATAASPAGTGNTQAGAAGAPGPAASRPPPPPTPTSPAARRR
ncbi:ATP-binding protein [Ramlibacter sp.]|uniref:ATP-binding protein n=1 Tax=Ramlibacter sp. TaxID=1917967 RepID=UPI002BBC9A6A|nr:ATP-binding protein [Ramlibacter sp.]HWI83597.1 ATP-binding protein [Ramlibacter sp.]